MNKKKRKHTFGLRCGFKRIFMQNGMSVHRNLFCSCAQSGADMNQIHVNCRLCSCTTLKHTRIEWFVFGRTWFITLKRLNTLRHWADFVCTSMWEMEATAYVQVMDRAPWVWPGVWQTGCSNNTTVSNSPSGYVHTHTHTFAHIETPSVVPHTSSAICFPLVFQSIWGTGNVCQTLLWLRAWPVCVHTLDTASLNLLCFFHNLEEQTDLWPPGGSAGFRHSHRWPRHPRYGDSCACRALLWCSQLVNAPRHCILRCPHGWDLFLPQNTPSHGLWPPRCSAPSMEIKTTKHKECIKYCECNWIN